MSPYNPLRTLLSGPVLSCLSCQLSCNQSGYSGVTLYIFRIPPAPDCKLTCPDQKDCPGEEDIFFPSFLKQNISQFLFSVLQHVIGEQSKKGKIFLRSHLSRRKTLSRPHMPSYEGLPRVSEGDLFLFLVSLSFVFSCIPPDCNLKCPDQGEKTFSPTFFLKALLLTFQSTPFSQA